MTSTTEKTAKTNHIAPKQANGNTFFRKAEEPSFFQSNDKPAFFGGAAVQTKLSVSTPDDPHEKEADRMADHVMRMAEPAAPAMESSSPHQGDELQRKEEEPHQEVHTKLEAPGITSLQCKLQRRAIQARLRPAIQRSHTEEAFTDSGDTATAEHHKDGHVSLKANPLCRSSGNNQTDRGPPAASTGFESTLSSSKGHGSALPADTMDSMNSRFNTDFSGVRIHTGTTAETLSSSINAQAFTHGSDIYFNTGKFQPGTEGGGHLLAHELTHTIQQGSVSQPAQGTAVSRKPSIQRMAADRPVPSQLNNAVAKAKGEVGKVNAGEAGPDGFRTGWPRLIEYFKTTLGDDKVIADGQPGTPGAVAESDIKKQRKIDNALPPANPRPASGPYTRDAMPSWCGIFAFWSLHKGGVPLHKWVLGGPSALDLKAAYPPGYIPKAGDIAYRNAFSHYALVEKASGDTVTTINGNTSGENNLGAQIQVKDHPLSNWTAFFDPLMLMDGQLGTGEQTSEEKPKTLKELRQELFHVNRKEEESHAEHENMEKSADMQIQAKQELSNWSVDANGGLSQSNAATAPAIQAKEELEHKEDEQPEQEHQHEPAVHDVQRKAEDDEHEDEEQSPGVKLKVDKKSIQRSWFGDALSAIGDAVDFVADGLEAGKKYLLGKARDFVMAIPGYKALRVVLGEDPITDEVVERNGHNFIEAAFDIMPGGQKLHDKLQELGALTEAENYIDRQIVALTSLVQGIENDVSRFWDNLSLSDIAHPTDVFERIGTLIYNTISSIVTFAVNAAGELLEIVKKFLLDQLVSFIKEHTDAYPLLTVILGEDPITGQHVDKNGTNILYALLELGGDTGREQRKQMQETGTFKKVADYIDRGIVIFGHAYDQIKAGIASIWDFVSIDALIHPIDTFQKIYDIFATPVGQVMDFVMEVGAAILKFIKEVLMSRLSTWAKGTRGYFLVTVIIGIDPFTRASVPRNVENVIHGFMSLMDGGEEQFAQMKESGAIDRTTQRINAAVEKLNMTPASIIQLFVDLWHSFSLNDLIHPIAAFQRIIATFGEPIMRLIAFVIEIIKIVIDVIMQIMNFPTDLIKNIITKAMQAIDMIKKDPIGFLKNLLRAIKEGFTQFFGNIINHLLFGLTGWLMSELKDAGVPELKDTSLKGVISWALEILNISMETIWKKLTEHPKIGPAKVAKIRGMINTLEGIWTFIKDVQERGIAAIWDKIKEQLSNLWDTVLTSIKNWVMDQIVNKVTAKLLSMLDPTGIMAVINGAIALYKAVQSFIKYITEMLRVVNSFVEGVVEIASGNTRKAADYLENALHNAMPIVIGFLANQVGLGGIGHQIAELIGSARQLVDEALTWLVNKAVDLGGKLIEMGKNAVNAVMDWWKSKKEFTVDNEDHEISVQGTEDSPQVIVASEPTGISILIENRRNSKPKPTKEERDALDAIEIKYTDLVKYIKDNRAAVDSGNKGDNFAESIRIEVNKRLAAIIVDIKKGKLLQLTGAEKALPVTPMPTYGGTTGDGFGKRMEVTPLTKLGTTGSEVNAAKITEYEKLLNRKRVPKGKNTYYVAGHLLNNNVHGDGGQWANLTPLANTTNQDHERDVESKVKEAVENNMILHYTVKVEYGMKKKTALLKEIEKVKGWETNSVLSKKHDIIDAESTLPKKLLCSLEQVEADGVTKVAKPEAKYNFTDREVDNEKNVAQANLDVYDLEDDIPKNYTSLEDLVKLRDKAIKNNFAWTDFYDDVNNKPSIDNLKPDDRKDLKAPFDLDEMFNDEMGKISKIKELDSLSSFSGGRIAYNKGVLNDKQLAKLLKSFYDKMKEKKDELIDKAIANVAKIKKADYSWGDFRQANDLFPKTDILDEATDIQKFKTKYFDKKIDSLLGH